MDMSVLIYFILKGLEISSPIAFAALGGVFSEKSGVVNIGLEGFMIVTSFFIVWASLLYHNIWIGLSAAVIAGIIMALIHAIVSVTFRVDQIVSGVAINIFALGLTRFLSQKIYGQETQTPPNPYTFSKFSDINSFSLWLIPIAILSWFILNKTVFGLRLRTVGENPEAADTLGINVYLMRYIGVMISGVFCGLSAATLFPSQWVSGMTAGRGFIALAAMIFGRWEPYWSYSSISTFRIC